MKAEALAQQRFALRSSIASQARLDAVAFPLLRAAVPLCRDNVALRTGISYTSLKNYDKDWRNAAQAEGVSDTVTILSVVPQSPAARAGLKSSARIIAIDNAPVPAGQEGMHYVGDHLAGAFTATKSTASLAHGAAFDAPVTLEFPHASALFRVQEDSAVRDVLVQADTVCSFNTVVVKDDQLNAFADGRTVFVTSAMMRFASDDAMLAVVVGHEIGHNAMRHMDAKKRNSMLGAFFGAVLDVAMATQGVNTNGSYTNQMAAIGAMTFSQDFEREADMTGLYILARANRDLGAAPLLWRQMAAEAPGSIKFATSHPTTAERFVRLAQWSDEIEAKRAAHLPLVPSVK